MCGIWASIQDTNICTESYIKSIIDNVSKLISHRGPDSFNYKIIDCGEKSIIMVHTRLHIVGNSEPQPIINDNIILIINGEIFNWKELSEELNYSCKQSDCEIIIGLYKKYIRYDLNFEKFYKKINGQFSFVLYDKWTNNILVSRDHVGITPLYYGYDEHKIVFSSEMKGLSTCNIDENKNSFVKYIKVFQPRTYLHSNLHDVFNDIISPNNQYLNYYELDNNYHESGYDIIQQNIKIKLENSIYTQLTDLINLQVDFGVLLSGGLDSSLISSIISKKMKTLNKKVKTFSIGLSKNSTDLIASRKVAKFLNTDHHEFYFTSDEGLSSIKDVIWYVESYDTTTIRASTAMYILTKKIKEKFPTLKVLFSGELSDEMLSYLYGSNAPNETDFQKETIRLVSDVHLFDCLRANKSCMGNSIETRVPFADPDLIKYILKIPPKFKIFGKLNNYKTVEKQILRDAFNITDENGEKYLPEDILWRKKEAFSDGISTFDIENNINWIDSIIEFCNNKYGIISYSVKRDKYTYNKPITTEQLYYREIFCELFNTHSFANTSEFTVNFWAPKWCGDSYVDPSARKHIKNDQS